MPKPMLVAAAIDYDMIKGRKLGDIARRVADDIRAERRLLVGFDRPPQSVVKLPGSSPEERRQRWLEGGLVIVGRHTLKEYMAGLKRGWTDGLEVVDREEQLARALEDDGKFDEPEPEPLPGAAIGDDEPLPTPSRIPSSSPFNVLATQNLRAPPPSPKSSESLPARLNAPPSTLSPQSPMLLVSFTNHIGLTQIPIMIWDFFNERYKVRDGAEAALKLIWGNTRPFSAPPAEVRSLPDVSIEPKTPQKPFLAELSPTDLDFDREAESYYKKSVVRDFLSEIEQARKSYYDALVKKLETARALARGTREPTKEERNYPPPTEVELRAERLKKELRWRNDEEGFNIIRPDKDIEWDERFRNVLGVYTDPSPEHTKSDDASPTS